MFTMERDRTRVQGNQFAQRQGIRRDGLAMASIRMTLGQTLPVCALELLQCAVRMQSKLGIQLAEVGCHRAPRMPITANAIVRGCLRPSDDGRDRKSTRLNSSH